jgi:proteasome beta subunit
MRELKTGTTIVAIKAKDGVVVASDRRAVLLTYIASRDFPKIYKITDNVVIAAAGVASDFQFLAKILSANMKLKELRSGKNVTAKEVANFLSTLMYSHKMFPYLVEVVIAGKNNGGYGIYSLDPAGGINEEKDFCAYGSGMMFALGVLESNYKKDITVKAAKELAKQAILAAIQRDTGSGDGIEIVTITKDGVKQELIKLNEIHRASVE